MKWFVILLIASWTVITVIYILWSRHEIKKSIREAAINQARIAYAKDIVYLRWNAFHGGVYVPVTEKTPPNQYLKVPERDIMTPSGRLLTLINPSYMTRQVHEIGEEDYGLKGHITSLNPIHPLNTPDPWERKALESFHQGTKDITSFEMINRQPFIRYMKPFVTEKRCLKCHAEQGYKVGDIHGGISVSVPMSSFLQLEKSQLIELYVSHGILWIIGLGVIGFSAYTLKIQSIKGRLTEEALKESEENYRILVDNAHDAVVIIQDGLIQFYNSKTEELFGYYVDELIYMPFVDLIHSEDQKILLEKIEQKAEHSSSLSHFRAITSKGEELWVQINCVDIVWEGHDAVIIFIRDMTSEKKLQVQLNQIQKMEAIGSLAGGIAHDFNNVLMGIQGNTSLMLMGIDSSHPHYEYLMDIGKLIKSSAKLTRQLLDFSRNTVFEVKSADMNKLIAKVTYIFGRTNKEIKISFKPKKNLPVVHVDKGQIEQVLLNLFVNAWHAMPDGGQLTIETDTVTLSRGNVRPFGIAPGMYVKILVTDTGTGMDEATKQRIFEPFFTTKKKGKGSGLGLASAYNIIKNHYGIINVYSEKGKGTTFTLYLPAAEKNLESQKQEKKQPESMLQGSGTVLLVDDEEKVISINARLLESLGYTVLKAHSGKEAIEIYTNNSDTIDIVIVDFIMPDMDGEKTIKKLREMNKNLKVILTSGYNIDGFADKIMNCGCDGFIQKPFTTKAISHKLAEILGG